MEQEGAWCHNPQALFNTVFFKTIYKHSTHSDANVMVKVIYWPVEGGRPFTVMYLHVYVHKQ